MEQVFKNYMKRVEKVQANSCLIKFFCLKKKSIRKPGAVGSSCERTVSILDSQWTFSLKPNFQKSTQKFVLHFCALTACLTQLGCRPQDYLHAFCLKSCLCPLRHTDFRVFPSPLSSACLQQVLKAVVTYFIHLLICTVARL